MGRPCFQESCRMVQGSKTADFIITTEQRTQRFTPVDCAGPARYSGYECRPKGRNKSGTAEVHCAFVSYYGDKGAFFIAANQVGRGHDPADHLPFLSVLDWRIGAVAALENFQTGLSKS